MLPVIVVIPLFSIFPSKGAILITSNFISTGGIMPKSKHPKFAPLTLDSTFKKAFASERSKNLLLFLLNAFLAEKLKRPIKEVKMR